MSAHAERDREFGAPAERNYQYPPEIVAAFRESCERSGAREADEVLSAVDAEMKQLAKAINASPVNSIGGLRAKALVAFWEVAPLCAGDTEFSFDDAYPSQQLFTAVAELCGLKDKMAATATSCRTSPWSTTPPMTKGRKRDDHGQQHCEIPLQRLPPRLFSAPTNIEERHSRGGGGCRGGSPTDCKARSQTSPSKSQKA